MDDLISRQAALDALNEYFARIGKMKRGGLREKAIGLDVVGAIKALPPVQPKHKTGYKINQHQYPAKWVCSECGAKHFDFSDNFCSQCGADVRGEA